jgi:hypothetical protein
MPDPHDICNRWGHYVKSWFQLRLGKVTVMKNKWPSRIQDVETYDNHAQCDSGSLHVPLGGSESNVRLDGR